MYGTTSVGSATVGLKGILRKERINVYRKGGKHILKKRLRKKDTEEKIKRRKKRKMPSTK